jgi:hypothetical protein
VALRVRPAEVGQPVAARGGLLRPLHGSGSVAAAAGQQRFTVPPTTPGGAPLFRQGTAFVSHDNQDPNWAQIAKFSRARLSVATSITGHQVGTDGTPVTPPLTDKALSHGSATCASPARCSRPIGSSVPP